MIILIVLVVLIVIIAIGYNVLVTERNNVKNAWSQIDVQLQRRFDLIPNLVETVKGYMEHEEKLLTGITELRTSWSSANTVGEKSKLNNQLSNTLKSIMAICENYPDLKANQNFSQLQLELSNTEDKIASSRVNYNNCVTNYNTKIEIIPLNIIASICNFKPEELFELENENIGNNVKISF